MNSQDIAKELLERLKVKEDLDNKLTQMNKDIFFAEQDLYDKMEAEGIDSVEIEGIKFAPEDKLDFALADEYSGQQWDNIAAWFDWLKNVGEAGLIKTKESVHAATRKRFLKDWVEEGKQLPDFVEQKYVNTIKYNKSAIKRLVNGSE